MERNYEINIFDEKSLDKFSKDLEDLSNKLSSKEFLSFVADKCMLEITRISNERLDGLDKNSVEAQDISNYRSNHKVDIGDDYLIISNDTMADLSQMSSKTLEKYPEGLSIAKVIEFGTGISGSDNDEFGWTTQMNPKRNYEKGWYYEKDGQIKWTKGTAGKFIYYELIKSVKENLSIWVDEFIFKE